MIRISQTPWLAFPALGLSEASLEREVQAVVYLAQVGGIDLGYQFGLLDIHPTSLDLSVDFADWREDPVDPSAEDITALQGVSRRYGQVETKLVSQPSCSVVEWLAALCSVHYLATREGIRPEVFAAQSKAWNAEVLAAAEALLRVENWLKPSLVPAQTIQAFPAELACDKAKAQKLLDQAAAVFEQLGYTVTYSIQAKSEVQHVSSSSSYPALSSVPSAGPAAAA